MQTNKRPETSDRLRRGDHVRVKSAAQIMSTLDQTGCLDGMPFMPEMLSACGKVFSVYARADKTCDTATRTGGRRLFNTVHLAGERCNGSGHGGCQAACLNFWKEDWLESSAAATESDICGSDQSVDCADAVEKLQKFAVRDTQDKNGSGSIYSCQATMLPTFTKPLAWWDLRQYWRDIAYKNVRLPHFLKITWLALYRKLVASGVGYRFWVYMYNSVQNRRGKQQWPLQQGTSEKTPTGTLNLRPGELVRIRPLDEIMKTIGPTNKNRGLAFDVEMAKYCEGTYRVQSRVDHIINEETGVMMHFGNPCIILENVWCSSEWSDCRLFCPRGIYHYWREIWLERVDDDKL